MASTEWKSLRAYDEQRFNINDKSGFSVRKEPFSRELMIKLGLMALIALLGGGGCGFQPDTSKNSRPGCKYSGL